MTVTLPAARSTRPDLFSLAPRWIALALFVLTLVLRIPFASQTLNHWDSVSHAMALTSYNVLEHRPQPPGYIVYIAVGRLVNFIFPDPQTALVTVSILASALAIALLFLLGAHMFHPMIGLVAALLLLTSPAFWFDGEVALPYVVEGCFGVTLVFLLYKLRQGETRWAPVAAVVFALAIGARQQMVVFFAPLVVYVFWNLSWRARIEGALWFGIVCLVWFVPLMWSAGGLNRYLLAVRDYDRLFADRFVLFGTGGLNALLRNTALVGAYTMYAVNLASVPLLYGIVSIIRKFSWRVLWRDERARFLFLWITPALTFYLLFHMGSPGLIYSYLPALFLFAAVGVFRFARQMKWRAASVALLCAVNVFIFFGTPPDLYMGREVRVLNYSSLREHDVSLSARVNGIREHFNPQTTVVLASDWRFAEYYLPEYRVLFFTGETTRPHLLTYEKMEIYTKPDAPVTLPRGTTTVVLFDPLAASFFRGTTKQQCFQIADGTCLAYFVIAPSEQLSLQPNALVNVEP